MKKPSSGGIAANDVSPPEKTKFKTRYRYYCKASYTLSGYFRFRFFSAARLLSEPSCSPIH